MQAQAVCGILQIKQKRGGGGGGNIGQCTFATVLVAP